MKQPPVNIKNKRATFDYELIDTYTAGIVLTGTEIKSIRLGKASLVDTFCYFTKGELWVKNMHIAEYFYGSYNNHTARRERKLLLSKKELEKLQREMKNPGFTIVPADGSYKVSFGEDEFVAFFKEFLRPGLVEMLF